MHFLGKLGPTVQGEIWEEIVGRNTIAGVEEEETTRCPVKQQSKGLSHFIDNLSLAGHWTINNH